MTEKIQIETVKTKSFVMDYFKFGHGMETLVILPGLSVQSVMGFANAVAEAYKPLSDDFTVYLFDRRKDMPPAYSVKEMAQDTADAIRASGLDRVCLFGASQGGMIAMEIAIGHPELVQKLVLGSTASRVTEMLYRTLDNWVELAKSKNATDLYLAFGESLYPHDMYVQLRDILIETAKTVTDEELERFIILAQGMKDFNVTDDLVKIACPVLAIGSEDDQVLGADGTRRIAERLNDRADFELFMYYGYGHAAYDTAPDYKERMLRFLVPASGS